MSGRLAQIDFILGGSTYKISFSYTMDPQKRTVINQLATQACYVFILQNLIGIPSATYVIIADDAGM